MPSDLYSRILFSNPNGLILPEELISMVFSNVPDGPHSVDSNETWLEFITLLSASHVCRQWRRIAENTPQPWAQLLLPDIQDDYVVKELLKRSKTASISVASSPIARQARSSRFATPGWRRVLSESFERLQRIWIKFNLERPDNISPLELLILRAAPSLKTCKLDCEEDMGQMPIHEYKLRPTTVHLFDGDAKHLRCLSINSCIMPPQADFSGLTLTHLHLKMGVKSAFQPTLKEWLQILNHQPLGVLTLLNFRYREVAKSDIEGIELPRLRSIFLSGNIIHCGKLFNALGIPGATCDVRLEIQRYSHLSCPELQQGLSRFLSEYQSDMNNIRLDIYRWICEIHGHRFLLALYEVSSVQERSCSRFSPSNTPKLLIDCDDYFQAPLADLIDPFLRTIAASRLPEHEAVLHLHHGVDWDADPCMAFYLIRFLSAFKNATAMTLDAASIERVISSVLVMSPVLENVMRENGSLVLLPKLKELALLDRLSIVARTDNLEAFKSYLDWRYAQEKPIPKVLLNYQGRLEEPIPIFDALDFHAETLECAGNGFEVQQDVIPACTYCDES